MSRNPSENLPQSISAGSRLLLRCIACGTTRPPEPGAYACPLCGGLLEVRYPGLEELPKEKRRSLGAFLLRLFQRRTHSQAFPDYSGVWTYRDLFPLLGSSSSIITLAEGRTRLYDAPWISRFTPHAGSIFIKHEGENPSGSFKDRGMTVLISRAMEEGVRKVICASTGNTSASLAKYGTLAGLEVFVLVGAGRIAEGKLSQAKAYGAVILEVEGDFDLAQALVKNLAWGVPHIMLANSLNPFRLEGQKTILFEMLHQYTSRVRGAGAASERWSSPGWIVLPGGNLGNTSAFGKALRELHFLDMIDRVPRLAVIQAEKANPLERSILSAQKLGKPLSAMDSGDLVRVEAKTVASAIEIGNPVNFTKALKSLDFTKGVVVSVSDEEIMKAKGLIDGFGAGCEPASAASLAGFFRLRSKGVIGSGEDVILLTTGHVLKDPYANMQGPGRIIKAAPEEKAIRRILGV